ncbi:glycerophosphodiester phosphodiesterase [Sporosarcina trichiuri]|uniref:glycerophosphodiester phosphodiesterase n=1 Tax=Sporosarcina trichiuri TaxID=3056445 RepID=UPI0025B3A136|nr:glycerophosphodiester phosphodiesterase family protein [Sporosarcina sp. 0.2-SM1T-5]WJY28422.1 glycerophosphodiester phosphodiesterase family protein [Sporosarcina sp. 0.2-SM1T-5]
MELGNRPRVYAHRGASGAYFENTMEAFRGAAEEGADGIELDVQLSKDGVFFVIHDPDLVRLAGIRCRISDMEAADIDQVQIGRRFTRKFRGFHIPRLSKVITFALMEPIGLNVEMKETISENPDCLQALLNQLAVLDDVHLSSFDYSLIVKAKELEPSMETAFLLKKAVLKEKSLADYPAADAFHFHKRMLTDTYAEQWQAADRPIRIYGVDGTEPFIEDPPAYIHGWITDYPGRFCK